MKNFPFLLVASLAVACTSTKDDTAVEEDDTETDEDTQPSSEPAYEPELFIVTSYYAGEADVVPGTSYTGYESFDYNDGTYGAGEYNCQLVWDATGTSAAAPATCANCEFTFDLALAPRTGEDYIVDDGSCGEIFVTTAFQYAYTSDYNGYGASVLYEGSLWIYDGSVNGATPATVTFDGAKFTYGGGYIDYYYYY